MSKHEDTRISLHPLSFAEAIKKLVRKPKPRREDSPAAASDTTTSPFARRTSSLAKHSASLLHPTGLSSVFRVL